MTEKRIEELISITYEKNQLLNKIHLISAEQMERVEKEDMDVLSQIIDDKDILMEEIDKLDLSFISIFTEIKRENSIEKLEDLSVEKYPNLKELQDAVKEVFSTLTALSLRDEKIINTMKTKLEQTRTELRRIKEGKKAYKGYSSSVMESILIDEKK